MPAFFYVNITVCYIPVSLVNTTVGCIRKICKKSLRGFIFVTIDFLLKTYSLIIFFITFHIIVYVNSGTSYVIIFILRCLLSAKSKFIYVFICTYRRFKPDFRSRKEPHLFDANAASGADDSDSAPRFHHMEISKTNMYNMFNLLIKEVEPTI
jgi:hypothetical protein